MVRTGVEHSAIVCSAGRARRGRAMQDTNVLEAYYIREFNVIRVTHSKNEQTMSFKVGRLMMAILGSLSGRYVS